MLMIAGLLIGGIILLFVVLSVVGFVTPRPDDQDSAASGVIYRQ
jgi:hypothetical protein